MQDPKHEVSAAPTNATPSGDSGREPGDVVPQFAPDREQCVAIVELLIDLRAKATSVGEDGRLEALKLMGVLLQGLVGWCFPSSVDATDMQAVAAYRHRLATNLLALGLSDLGHALDSLNFGHAEPLVRPSGQVLRQGGLKAWLVRIKILQEVHLVAGVLDSETEAFERVSKVCNASVETLRSWGKRPPNAIKKALSEQMHVSRQIGVQLRDRLPTAEAREKFVGVYLAIQVQAAALALQAVRETRETTAD
jgi:hypothetical protein